MAPEIWYHRMRIRNYTRADLDALRRLHAAQGFGYPFPDLESPLFITKLVLEEDAPGDRKQSREEADDKPASREEPHTKPASREEADSSSPRVVMAVLLRLTAEAYLLHDASAGTPRQRWQNLLALHEAARQDAAARGLDDVQAFLPPQVARAFGRRLARLGWRPDPWPCFSRRTGL